MLRQSSIRRTDLRSPSSSSDHSSLDHGIKLHLQRNFENLYQKSLFANGSQDAEGRDSASDQDQPSGEEEYEFRLFAKPASVTKQPKESRITIRSPTPPSGNAGFLRAKRSESYYFVGPPSEQLRKQYEESAISGDQLVEGLKIRWVWLGLHFE